MEQAVADALADVKTALAHRIRPRSVPHYRMCYREEEVARFLARPASVMSAKDLRPILWDAYACWETWREVAHSENTHLKSLTPLPENEGDLDTDVTQDLGKWLQSLATR